MSVNEEIIGSLVHIVSDVHPASIGILQENQNLGYKAIYTGSNVNEALIGRVVKLNNSYSDHPYLIQIYNHTGKITCAVPAKEEDFEVVGGNNYHFFKGNVPNNPNPEREDWFIDPMSNRHETFLYHILPSVKGTYQVDMRYLNFSPNKVTFYYLKKGQLIEIFSTQNTSGTEDRVFYHDPSENSNVLMIHKRYYYGSGIGVTYSLEYKLHFIPDLIR